MTKEEAMDKWLAGALAFVGEYRSSETEVIEWRDKQSGRLMSAPILRHVVEFGSKSVLVAERVGVDFDGRSWVSPFAKGERVFCHVTELNLQRGVYSARGKLERLG